MCYKLITYELQDVMVVGEPTLMGGEFGDEDERVITRLENNQYEANGTEEPGMAPGAPNPAAPGPPVGDIKPPTTNGGTTPSNTAPGGSTTPGGGATGSQFHGSPSLQSPWGTDKKTPQPMDVPPIETKTE